MNIQFESELMENRKHAEVMAPDKTFDVLQSQDGDSLFFSLGTDGVFYLTREARATNTGWDRLDLSSALAGQLKAAKVTAKAFAVSQDMSSGNIDLALAVTAGDQDHLLLSLGHANTDAAWAASVPWTHIPFDATGVSIPKLSIAELYMLQSSAGQFFVVDNLKDPANPLRLIDRFFIQPDQAVKWHEHQLSADLSGGSLTTELGQRGNDQVAGTYNFGQIGRTTELIFMQLYNAWKPGIPGLTARLALPSGASAMAVSTDPAGSSTVFVAGGGVLSMYAPNAQGDGAVGVPIVHNALFTGSILRAAATSGKTAVWGVNQQGDLFYVQCPAGSEAEPSAWSTPVPILTGVENIASFLNLEQHNSVIFAHTNGSNLVQLTQDPVTTLWQQRSILLPSTSPDDVVTYQSFTTHVTITDDFNNPQPNASVSITSASPVTVYANDVYHTLSPTVPVALTTDVTGVLTLVQETQSLSAVCYTLDAGSGVTVAINPMSKIVATLAKVQSGDDLGQVQVEDADGNRHALIPSGVTSDQKAAAANTLKQFSQIAAGLPVDGSKKPANSAAASKAPRAAAQGAAYSVRFTQSGTIRSNVAHTAALTASNALDDLGSAIEVAAGDFFQWVKSAFDDVVGLTIQVVDDVSHFFVQLGDKIYHLVLDCVGAVVSAVELVFNKIKVFFEDLIKWLGFLFQWKDIVRTHLVLKNMMKCYVCSAVQKIETGKQDLIKLFTGLESRLDAWAGLPDTPNTIGQIQQTMVAPSGHSSPQANYGMHHMKSNQDAMTGSFAGSRATPDSSLVDKLLADLEGAFNAEVDAFRTALDQLRTEVIAQKDSLTPVQVLKKVTAIILNLLLTTAENILVTALDLLELFVEGMIDVLDEPITIPILSPLYKEIADADLSILDLLCLVSAIPVTVIYKAVRGVAPFPDDATTAAMTNAQDVAGLARAVQGTKWAPAAYPKAMARAAAVPGRVQLQAAARQPVASPPGGGVRHSLGGSDPDAGKLEHVADELGAALGIVGFFGAVAVSIFASKKNDIGAANFIADNSLEEAASLIPKKASPLWLINLGAFVSYLPFVLPNLPANLTHDVPWYVALNDAVTLAAIIKTGLDNVTVISGNDTYSGWVSPILECVLNIVWVVPAGYSFAASDKKTSDKLSLASNCLFDFGGMISPPMSYKYWSYLSKEKQLVAVTPWQKFGIAMNIGYGGLCLLYSTYVWSGD